VLCGAVGCGRAITTIVASGSCPSPETPFVTIHSGLEVDAKSCIRHAAPTGGWITRGEVLICTTDE